jgi:hypothetical protein
MWRHTTIHLASHRHSFDITPPFIKHHTPVHLTSHRPRLQALFSKALDPPAPSPPSGPTAAPAALPKAPNTAAQEAAAAAAAAAARAAYEADQGVLRALRMTLRGITLKLLCDRR